MPPVRFRLSTIVTLIAVVAVLLAFDRLKPRNDGLGIIPFELFVILLAIILVVLVIMLRAFHWK